MNKKINKPDTNKLISINDLEGTNNYYGIHTLCHNVRFVMENVLFSIGFSQQTL